MSRVGRRIALAGAAAGIWLLTAACAGTAPRAELRVAAASSLGPVIERAAGAFEAGHGGVSIVVATDSSAALRTQIEQGAAFDVFLSADPANARALADAGLAAGEPVAFATSPIVLAVAAGNPAAIETPADLARGGVIIVAAAEQVPLTGYAEELVARLAEVDGYPAGFAEAYLENVASREDNAAAVVAKLALGEGDAAFVYASDAARNASVATVPIPDEARVSATYLGLVVRASDDPEAATEFLGWLTGPAGRALLAEHGFPAP